MESWYTFPTPRISEICLSASDDWQNLGNTPPTTLFWTLIYVFCGLIWDILIFWIIKIWLNLGAPSKDWQNQMPPSYKWLHTKNFHQPVMPSELALTYTQYNTSTIQQLVSLYYTVTHQSLAWKVCQGYNNTYLYTFYYLLLSYSLHIWCEYGAN